MFRRSAGKTREIAEEHPPDDAEAEPDEPASLAQRLDVTGTQVCASTLASVSAAAVASIFGVTGTIVGAAVMSVIATTGSALYSHGIRRTGAKLQQTPVAEVTRRLGPWPRADVDPTTAAPRHAAPAATVATAGPDESPRRPVRSIAAPGPGWRSWLAQRRWGVALGVVVVFVATLGVVTLVELAGQRSLAGLTGDGSGRTSIGSFLDGSGSADESPGSPGGTSTTIAPGDDPTVTDAPATSDGDSVDDPADTGDPDDPADSATTEPSAPTTDQGEAPAAEAPSA